MSTLAEAQVAIERLTDCTYDNKGKNASIGQEGGKFGKPGKPKSGEPLVLVVAIAREVRESLTAFSNPRKVGH